MQPNSSNWFSRILKFIDYHRTCRYFERRNSCSKTQKEQFFASINDHTQTQYVFKVNNTFFIFVLKVNVWSQKSILMNCNKKLNEYVLVFCVVYHSTETSCFCQLYSNIYTGIRLWIITKSWISYTTEIPLILSITFWMILIFAQVISIKK